MLYIEWILHTLKHFWRIWKVTLMLKEDLTVSVEWLIMWTSDVLVYHLYCDSIIFYSVDWFIWTQRGLFIFWFLQLEECWLSLLLRIPFELLTCHSVIEIALFFGKFLAESWFNLFIINTHFRLFIFFSLTLWCSHILNFTNVNP